jgi:hypothetical protein
MAGAAMLAFICVAPLAAVRAATGTPAAPSRPEIPESFRGAPAVVLEEHVSWTVNPKGRQSVSSRERTLILDRRGFSEADRYLTYFVPGSKLLEFDARTISPRGDVIPVEADLRRETTLVEREGYEVHLLQFTFPAVEVGSVLEWEYRLEDKDSGVIESWEAQRDVPVLAATYSVRVRDLPRYKPGIQPYSRVPWSEWCKLDFPGKDGNYVTRELTCRDLPAWRREKQSPPEGDTRLEFMMTWFNRALRPLPEVMWSYVNKTWSGRVTSFLSKRDQVRATVWKLVTEEQPDSEKINEIHRYLDD